MVLHIALEGIDGTGKTTQTKLLKEFLTKKNYKVTTMQQPTNKQIISILNQYKLTNKEIALLMAFDRLHTHKNNNWEKYDIVIWDRSILSSYVYNTSNTTPAKYIKQINRYFPTMDLYIIIETPETITEQDYTNTPNIIKKYHDLINNKDIIAVPYQPDKPKKMLEEIVTVIFDYLPKCQWCGRLFKPTQQHKKYCKDECSKYSLLDQNRINNQKYYYKYKDVMSERQKGALGSKGANLHGTPDKNPLAELEKVRKAKKALGLKPIQ